MKRVLATVIVAAMAIGALSSVSFATENSNAKIQLHLTAKTTKNDCTWAPSKPACGDIVTHGNLYPALYFAYVLVTDANIYAGIAGMQFGISYGSGMADGVGVDIYSWKLCGTLEFQQPSPVWPSDGGGNMITWDWTNACQTYVPPGNDATNGVCTDAGYFYLAAYTAATLQITPRPVDGYAKVASCAAQEDIIEGPGDGTSLNPPVVRTPSHLGSIGFDNDTPTTHPGYNPCGVETAIENTTWSNVKSLYTGQR